MNKITGNLAFHLGEGHQLNDVEYQNNTWFMYYHTDDN